MSRKPVEIGVASDTRDFQKGIRDGVVKPLEGVEDALDDLARDSARTSDNLVDDARDAGGAYDDLADDAKKSARKVEDAMQDAATETESVGDSAKDAARDVDDAMRDAQRDTEALEKATKELHDTIEKGSRDAYRKMEKSSNDASKDARDDVGEFRDEAKQNFSEVASSFSGDMDSAVDLVQGTLGGLAGSIPGYGLALGGLGAAAGVFYAQWKEKTEATKARIGEMYDDMLDSGETYLSESYQQEQYWSILKDESEILSLKKTKEYARQAGTSYETVAMAWSGNHDAMQQVMEGLYAKREELMEESKTWDAAEAEARSSEIDGINNIIGKHESRRGEIEETTDRVNKERRAWELNGTSAAQSMKDASEEMGRTQERLRGLHLDLEDLPTSKTVKVKTEWDQSSMDRGLRNLPKTRTVRVTADLVARNGRRIY